MYFLKANKANGSIANQPNNLQTSQHPNLTTILRIPTFTHVLQPVDNSNVKAKNFQTLQHSNLSTLKPRKLIHR